MILRAFKRNDIGVQILLILIMLPPLFLHPIQAIKALEYGTLYPKIYEQIKDSSITFTTLSFISLLFNAVFLSLMMRRFDLVSRLNFMPTLVYLILFGAFPGLLNFNPLTLATPLLLLGFYFLFRVNEEDYPYNVIFNASFFFGIASLMYFPLISFVVFIPFAFIIFRIFRGRELLISLLAFLMPWLFVAVYHYLNDTLVPSFNQFVSVVTSFSFPSLKAFSTKDAIMAFGVIIAATIISFRSLLMSFEQRIQVRILISLSVVYLAYTALSLGLAGKYFLMHPALIIFPLSLLVTIFLKNLKKTLYFDLFILLIIIGEYVNAIYKL